MAPTRASFPSWAYRSRVASSDARSRRYPRLGLLLLAGSALVSCGDVTGGGATPEASATPAAVAEKYVALGDAFTAGMVSDALVETHQAYSFPAQIARQSATSTFQQPLVSVPGIEVELELRRFYQGPVSIAPRDTERGSARNANLAVPFNNLGVPGFKLADLFSTTGDSGVFAGVVLRNFGTAISQCRQLKPTLVTLWIGNSDILTAVLGGRAIDGTTLTPESEFEASFTQAIKTLTSTTSATIVVGNIPDFTQTPFATSIKPYVVDATTGEPVLKDGQRIGLIGPRGTPLASSALVTLAASDLLANGDGIPILEGGTGASLPDSVVLDQNEVDTIQERVAAYNRIITKVCSASSVPVVDLQRLFGSFATGVTVGGTRLDSTFLTGGLFGYDGVHPSDIGYALIANEWIRVLNENGATIPLVDVSPIMGFRGSAPEKQGVQPLPWFRFSHEARAALLAVYGVEP